MEPIATIRPVMSRVVSSNIAAWGYDHENRVLDVEFQGKRIHRYYEVPPEIVEGLRGAPSVGSYFHREIRNTFRNVRLSDDYRPTYAEDEANAGAQETLPLAA